MEIELRKEVENAPAGSGNSTTPPQHDLNGWQCFLRAFTNYATFSGRARRKEFWYFYLFTSIISALLSVIDSALGLDGPNVESGEGGLLTGLFGLAMVVPYFAVLSRRLHDVGRSAKWILACFISFVLMIPVMVFLDTFWLISFPVGIGLLILFWTLKNSQHGSNKWGANPKGF
tara:strand:- start:303 stop:824 length:522 start_codon:yes stop_codon:yes gene_type:complete